MSLETILSFTSIESLQPAAGKALMILLGLVLVYLAIAKEYEPVLLLPIGFGCILANLGMAASADGEGFLSVLYRAGIESELFPLLIFIGVGRYDRFQPAVIATLSGFIGRRRPIWHLRHIDISHVAGIRSERGRIHRCDRRH